MYSEGADYVVVPSILTAKNLIWAVNLFLKNDQAEVKSFIDGEKNMLQNRNEVMH
jgi:hypothetical protein